MKKLRGEGLSFGKIADRLGLAPMTVYNYLRKKEKTGYIGKMKRKMAPEVDRYGCLKKSKEAKALGRHVRKLSDVI